MALIVRAENRQGMEKTPGMSAIAADGEAAARSRIVEAGGAPTPGQLAAHTFRTRGEAWPTRVDHGESLRRSSPFEGHACWTPAANRPDPIALVEASNAGRLPDLIPLRWARMAASPFAFLRGAASVMAWDLARGPSTGVDVVIDGDAHIGNFGLFGTPECNVVIDLNDFDEVTVGPWEWDLKRLTASVNVAARQNEMDRGRRRAAVIATVKGYRWNLRRLETMPILDLWAQHTLTNRLDGKDADLDKKTAAVLQKAEDKARETNNASMLKKSAERDKSGCWRFKSRPPILTPVDDALRDQIIDGLDAYLRTLPPERQYMLRRYHAVDVARRVAGVGSVGTRAYLVLLFGHGERDPLFLQIKEATVPAHAPRRPPLSPDPGHEGRRVVFGQRLLQAAGDPLLGWTDIDGRPFYVRQMKNLKGSIDVEGLGADPFNFFAWAYGSLLARAHARSGDAAVISGYCGKSGPFDDALADWAEAYGAQTRRDHAALLEAIESGRVKAVAG
jgi:uncharacterized protein (DUF2252 family)